MSDLSEAALYDAAFVCARDTTGHTRAAQREMHRLLIAQFPSVAPATVTGACTVARALLSACYTVGEACRHEAITHDEAARQLSECCPGFSPETYTQAVSYGMFASR